jgi:succinyl-diaminopimelate desuccinylase
MSPTPDLGRLMGLLERLVAIDTQNPPGNEAIAAALLADELIRIGFATELTAVAEGRANVVGRLDNGAGPCLAFNTHMDTVPVGEGWSGDPFRLRERDGRLYGRGACDAKGSITAMVEAGRLLSAERKAWRGTLLLAFVADEEIDGTGAKALVRQPPAIDMVVVGEPTGNAVYAAHKGCLRPLIRVSGKAAHSSRPELGVNAIVAASRLIELLDQRDRELRTHSHPLVGPASLSVTGIAGGIADNVIPDTCELVLDQRLLPGESLDAALADLRALLSEAGRDHGIAAELVKVRSMAGPSETALDQPIVREALTAAKRHGVTLPQPAGLTGGCDLVHFRQAGSVGIVLGPGSLAAAHQPDESVPKDDLAQAALIYRDIALAMLR